MKKIIKTIALMLCLALTGCGTVVETTQEENGESETMTETQDVPKTPVTFTDITEIEAGKSYTAKGEILFRFSPADMDYNIVQGGYFDGETWYVAMLNNKRTDKYESVKIQVMDKTGKLIRISEPLAVDHANNLTWLPEENCLLSTNCQSPDKHYARYTKIDLDTLTVKEASGDLEQPFFAMAYSPARGQFASGEWAGQALDVWDKEMKVILHKDVEKPATLSQGVFCDADSIYFVRSGSETLRSEIRIYDWELNLKNAFPVLFSGNHEPESINIVDETTYIMTNNLTWTGGVVYRVSFTEDAQ